MLSFNYETDLSIDKEVHYKWLTECICSEGFQLGKVDIIFTSDAYLLEINKKYLNHDYYTDIITFDYSEGNELSGDLFISIDRVKENASKYNVLFEVELRRVMAHGLLHLMGYGDKEEGEILVMRKKEDEKLRMFHVEQ